MAKSKSQRNKATSSRDWRERQRQDPTWLARERERCRVKSRNARSKDPVAHRSRLASWRATNSVSVLVSQTRSRAKKLGVVCDVDIDFVNSLLAATPACPYTKMPFDSPKPGGLRMNPWAPSLDRIDSKGAYTRDNIELVSNWWNLAKHEWPAEVVATALAGLRS